MAAELAAAEVLPYPLEPVRFTETFGCTVLEAMAAGCVPVITDADAFGELWSPASPTLPGAVDEDKFAEVLVRLATSPGELREWAGKCRAHAAGFAWPALARKLEQCLLTAGKEGFSNPWES